MRLKLLISGLIMLLLMTTILGYQQAKDQEAENRTLKAQVQATEKKIQYKVIEEPYTEILDHSIVFYRNRLELLESDVANSSKYTDVNGVSGFYFDRGNTHYEYIKGHLQGKQLMIYAPFYSSEEYDIEELQNKEEIEKQGDN